jgi:ornithine cyclodeaminase/alanine dehydrogenase-like protein (mu-crystallin family)
LAATPNSAGTALLIRDADVRAAVGEQGAIAAVAAAVVEAGRTEAPRSRTRIDLPAGGWLRVMTGALPESDVFGFKAFHLVGDGSIRYLCALYRLSDGAPLALLDADCLTALRTSATAAAAARSFWADKPLHVAVVGSGLLAQGGLRALATACEVGGARVFSPRTPSRTAFAERLGRELGVAITAVESVRAATEGADMLLCATHTRGSIAVHPGDLEDVVYVSSIASTLPAQRELDAGVFAEVKRMVIDTPDVLSESGDVLAAREAGTLDGLEVSELWRLLTGEVGGGVRTLYKSIGSVEQDLGLAHTVYLRCRELGLGQPVESIELGRAIAATP